MTCIHVARSGHVVTLEVQRPPHNFFDATMIRELADAFEAMDEDPGCRVLLLATQGRSFCAGANFRADESGVSENSGEGAGNAESAGVSGEELQADAIYEQALRIFSCRKPVVAAVQGAAIGGGLGLALVADFRIVTPGTKLAANFVKLGIHPGFGLTHTLPRLVGLQRAQRMFLTAEPVSGEEALEIGLADELVAAGVLRATAMEWAQQIAVNAPLAVQSTRATLREGLVDAIRSQTAHEFAEQARLFQTSDHREGVLAVREKRQGLFTGK